MSKLDHHNVLSIIGVSINPQNATLLMIMAFMDHGDVKSFLKSKRGDEFEFDCFPKVCVCSYIVMYVHINFQKLRNVCIILTVIVFTYQIWIVTILWYVCVMQKYHD